MDVHRVILRFFILAVLVSKSFQILAQWPQPIHFHEREGLLCGEIYQLACDDENYIWIASEYGLYRYDGYKFRLFTADDGLPKSRIIDVSIINGKVHVVCLNGSVSFFDGKRFKEHLLSHLLEENANGNSPHPKTLVVDDESVSLCFNNVGTIKATLSGQVIKNESDISLPDIHCFVNSFSHTDTTLIKVRQYLSIHDSSIAHDKLFKKGKIAYCKGIAEHFLNYGNLSFSISNGSITHRFLPTKIVSVGFADSVLYYAYKKGGISFHLPGEKLNLFPNFTVNHVITDKDGGVWIATSDNGLYYLKSLWIKNFNIATDFYYMDVSDISFTSEEDLLIAHRNFSIDRVSLSGEFLMTYTTHHNDGLTGLTYCQAYPIIASIFDNRLLTIQKPDGQYRVKNHPLTGVHSVRVFCDTLFISSTNGIHYVDPQRGELKHYLSYTSIRESKLFATSARLFLAVDNSLFEIKNQRATNLGCGEAFSNSKITYVSEFNHNLYVALRGMGIVQIMNGETRLINEINGFSLESVTSGCQNNNYLFYATNAGIITIPVETGAPNWNSSYILNQSVGISSLEIEKILVNEKYLYVKTKRSVDVIPLREISRIPKVEIPKPEVFIDGVQIAFSDTQYLDDEDNSLQFYFPLRQYRKERKIRIKYFINGHHNQDVETDQPHISILNLPYGEFDAVFQVRDYGGGWSNPLKMKIIKTEPYYMKTWIIVLIFIATFSLIAYAIFLRIILIYRKSELLAERREHSHNILAQQLNPHFTFNSLNAIHHFVLSNNREDSSRYLVKFSTLMRGVIEFSRKEYITIEEEIATLQLYVELEKLRFPGKFSFLATIEEKIDKNETLIIPFLIQPLVENAIRHGVTQRDTPGQIELEITEVAEFLKVSVTDNGIGRAEAHRRKQKSQQNSAGLGGSILKQRIKNYNAINRQKISINVVDLFSEDGSSSGTKVIVLLPLVQKNVYLDDH